MYYKTVAELGYSLVWQMGFSPESQHLSANLIPAVVVALLDVADTAAMESLKRFELKPWNNSS